MNTLDPYINYLKTKLYLKVIFFFVNKILTYLLFFYRIESILSEVCYLVLFIFNFKSELRVRCVVYACLI